MTESDAQSKFLFWAFMVLTIGLIIGMLMASCAPTTLDGPRTTQVALQPAKDSPK